MPGFAHVVFALGLSLFLHKASHGKFSTKHAIIFSVNSLVGPDIFGFLDYYSVAYMFFHGYGWLLAAVPLALAWSVFTRYSLRWVPFRVARRDPAREAIATIPEVYCLVAAGGIFHLFVDLIGHPPTIPFAGNPVAPWGAVWFGGDLWFSIDSLLGTGMFPCGNHFHFPEFYAYLVPVLALTLVLILFFMQRSSKHFQLASIIIIVAAVVPLAIAYAVPDTSGFDVYGPGITYYGSDAWVASTYRLTGGEADLGVVVFFGLFFFVPLILLWMSYDGVPFVRKRGLRAAIERIEAEERASARQRVAEVVAHLRAGARRE
ncbi:MAG: hypothetical protein JW839_01450 [Candidatus Lokiarchaeota archaeon]|nr:hypothetical protein [Candidatus Lokiarchaeota archaeon]